MLIDSGRATVTPDNDTPSFNVGPGDAIYFMHGFRCTWHIQETPLVQRYGYFSADGMELKETYLTCDLCSEDCSDESYLYNDEMDICSRCFKVDAKSAQQYLSTRVRSISVGGRRRSTMIMKAPHHTSRTLRGRRVR